VGKAGTVLTRCASRASERDSKEASKEANKQTSSKITNKKVIIYLVLAIASRPNKNAIHFLLLRCRHNSQTAN
jgi:hypothetical protein